MRISDIGNNCQTRSSRYPSIFPGSCSLPHGTYQGDLSHRISLNYELAPLGMLQRLTYHYSWSMTGPGGPLLPFYPHTHISLLSLDKSADRRIRLTLEKPKISSRHLGLLLVSCGCPETHPRHFSKNYVRRDLKDGHPPDVRSQPVSAGRSGVAEALLYSF